MPLGTLPKREHEYGEAKMPLGKIPLRENEQG